MISVCVHVSVCWMLYFFFSENRFTLLNFILNFVDRKPAVSIFQDVLKLLFTNSLVIPL